MYRHALITGVAYLLPARNAVIEKVVKIESKERGIVAKVHHCDFCVSLERESMD